MRSNEYYRETYADASEAFLRRTREAVMSEGKNIGNQEVLLNLARELSNMFPDTFDYAQFEWDFQNDVGMEKFREDLQKARYHQISSIPALTIRRPEKPGVLIVGYRLTKR